MIISVTISTANLFDSIHSALIAGRFADARRDLDIMLARKDNAHMLSAPAAYNLPKNQYGQLIADRIENVNSRARLASSK